MNTADSRHVDTAKLAHKSDQSADLFSVNPEIRSKMEDISDIHIMPCTKSIYIQPMTMRYHQNGRKKFWDFIKTHDSVSIILHNPQKQTLIFVRQFRPGVYVHNTDWVVGKSDIDVTKFPAASGITYELCAGIVDKNLPLAEIAREEVLEETGYAIKTTDLEKVTSMRSGVGIAGSISTTYYAKVDDSQKVSRGGGNDDEGELIEVVEIPVDRVKTMMFDEILARPAGFMFAMMWFFAKKCPG